MRIALILPGGLDPANRELVPAFGWLVERLARTHQVHVMQVLVDGDGFHQGEATVVNLAMPRRLAALALWQRPRAYWMLKWVADELRHRGPFDVVHGFGLYPCGWLATLAAKWTGAVAVATLVGGELVRLDDIAYGGARQWRERLESALTLATADAVTAASQVAVAEVERRAPEAIWLPLGVDRKVFPAPALRPAGPPWRLLHIARSHPVKGLDLLLEIARRLPDDRFVIDQIGGEVAETEAKGLPIRWWGSLDSHAVAAIACASHLQLVTSRWENQSVAMVEAAACGVPIIGTPVGLVPELAANGAAIVAHDATAAVAAIEQIVAEPARRQELSTRALAWAKHFDADWTASTLVELYQRRIRDRDRQAAR